MAYNFSCMSQRFVFNQFLSFLLPLPTGHGSPAPGYARMLASKLLPPLLSLAAELSTHAAASPPSPAAAGPASAAAPEQTGDPPCDRASVRAHTEGSTAHAAIPSGASAPSAHTAHTLALLGSRLARDMLTGEACLLLSSALLQKSRPPLVSLNIF